MSSTCYAAVCYGFEIDSRQHDVYVALRHIALHAPRNERERELRQATNGCEIHYRETGEVTMVYVANQRTYSSKKLTPLEVTGEDLATIRRAAVTCGVPGDKVGWLLYSWVSY